MALLIQPPEDQAGQPAGAPRGANDAPLQIAAVIRRLRQRSGLSQSRLAARAHVPRTYIAKIENRTTVPRVSSLHRLAEALNVTVSDLLGHGETSLNHNQDDQIAGLMADKIIAQAVPLLRRLDAAQRSLLLIQLSNLSRGKR